MDVQSMHIELSRSLNQSGANRGRKWKSEELDWELNKQQDRYIRSCLVPRQGGSFEVDPVRVDDISEIIVTGKSLVPYYDAGTKKYKNYLPFDYNYLLDDSSVSKNLCGEVVSSQSRNLYLTALKQPLTDKALAKFYETVIVELKNFTVSIPGDLPVLHSFVGYDTKKDLSLFLSKYIAAKGKWYWGQVGNYYYPEHYIKLEESNSVGPVQITIDGTVTNVKVSLTIPVTVHTNTGGNTVPNRLTRSDLISNMQADHHLKSSFYSPISELAGNILYTYGDNSFTISATTISYVRKPQIISLNLGTDCELSDSAAQTICDLTVEYLKGRVENVTGQKLAENDISKRVII